MDAILWYMEKIDEIDWDILEALQTDGRVSFSELGRRISMSAPAVTERVRRMEEAGIISGYRAIVNKEKLGIQVAAIVRISFLGPQHYPAIFDALAARPEVRRCHHVTGEDCLVVHVGCQSMVHLEEVVGFLTRYGSTTTSVEFSCPIEFQPITRELLDEPKTTPWGVETA